MTNFIQKRITPGKAIKQHCLWCCNGKRIEVQKCPTKNCLFYKHRLGKGRPSVKLIKKFCIGCSGGIRDAKKCLWEGQHESLCELFRYRLGKNPAYLSNRFIGQKPPAWPMKNEPNIKNMNTGACLDGNASKPLLLPNLALIRRSGNERI